MALMDAVVAGSGGKEPGVPRVSMYDVREYEVGRKFPPGHKIVEVDTGDVVVFAFFFVLCDLRCNICVFCLLIVLFF